MFRLYLCSSVFWRSDPQKKALTASWNVCCLGATTSLNCLDSSSSQSDRKSTPVASARPSSGDGPPIRPFVPKTGRIIHSSYFWSLQSVQYVHLHKQSAGLCCQRALKTRRPVLGRASLQGDEPPLRPAADRKRQRVRGPAYVNDGEAGCALLQRGALYIHVFISWSLRRAAGVNLLSPATVCRTS